VAPCSNASQTRDLESATCRCCTKNGYPANGDITSCCGGRILNGNCSGRFDDVCTYNEQCFWEYCFNGRCGNCSPNHNFCIEAGFTCGAGGGCLIAVDGTPRCGIPEDNPDQGDCGWCTRDFDCDQGQRPGYFCAVDTGPFCGCPTGQTFCAAPA
jgi:hypothetical protein